MRISWYESVHRKNIHWAKEEIYDPIIVKLKVASVPNIWLKAFGHVVDNDYISLMLPRKQVCFDRFAIPTQEIKRPIA